LHAIHQAGLPRVDCLAPKWETASIFPRTQRRVTASGVETSYTFGKFVIYVCFGLWEGRHRTKAFALLTNTQTKIPKICSDFF